MAQQTINNGESGQDVRTKLNAMFGEIYAFIADPDQWSYVRLVSDAVNSTVTINDTALAIALDSNSTYEIELKLMLKAAATTTGARPGVRFPTAGIVQSAGWINAPNSATAFVSRIWSGTGLQNVATTGIGAANVEQAATGEFFIVTGPSVTGNFIVTLASEIATSEVRLCANSMIKYRKVP